MFRDNVFIFGPYLQFSNLPREIYTERNIEQIFKTEEETTKDSMKDGYRV